MLLYHFPLTSSSATATIVNKGLKNDYVYNGNSTFTSGGKLSSYAKYIDNNNAFKLTISNFTTNHTLCFRVNSESRYYVCYINGVGITNSEITIENGSWYDVVITSNKVYVNGSYVKDYNYTNGNLTIGITNSFRGLIQDIRIYDHALSQAEINEYSRALVVHYPLQGNELNGSVLKDVSGFGNDYTLQGTNSYQLDSVRGVKSLHTTDTAIYIQTPISSGYTTSFWCKYNGEWKHLCNNGSKYVNGVVNASQYDTIYATLTASGYDIVDYRVYATALSAEDIKNLYNSPISVSNQHQTMAFEFKENPLYPSKYWRIINNNQMSYLISARTNASSLRTLCRVNTIGSTYVGGLLLLPDDWVLPTGISMTITTSNITTNTYSASELNIIEDNGGVFLPVTMQRYGTQVTGVSQGNYVLSYGISNRQSLYFDNSSMYIASTTLYLNQYAYAVRLCYSSQGQHTFSTSATTKIKFAPANLQYHCTQHVWRFAEHSYDFIGAANANISDSYNGWIDLFGYGTSGVNYSPTLHTTTNSDYASGDISNTDNDWGINEIQSYDYNVKNFAANKNGILQHNELRENDSEVNGCYNDKLITNELIEN